MSGSLAAFDTRGYAVRSGPRPVSRPVTSRRVAARQRRAGLILMSRMFSSLRATLLIPFVGVVILVAVSISLLSYQTGLKAVDELSEQLLLDISNRVTQATSRHLASSSVVLNAVAPDVAAAGNAPRHSDLVPDSLPQFEQRMWIAANLYPGNEGYIYYGSHKGEFVGLNRKADGDYELRWRELGTAQRTIYTTHGPGLRDAVLRTDNYDPRAGPGSPRPRSAAPDLVVGLCRFHDAGVDGNAGKTGVQPAAGPARCGRHRYPADGADRIRPRAAGQPYWWAFIVERDGALIATSTPEALFGDNPGQPVRLRASESANPLVRQAWGAVARNVEPTRSTVRGVEIARYSFDGDDGRVHMSATAQRDSAGLDWTMVVAVPRSDHMGNVQRTILQNVAIGLAAVGLAIALGLWIMHRVTSDDAAAVGGHPPAGPRAIAGAAVQRAQR